MTADYSWGSSLAFGDRAADQVAQALRRRGRVVTDLTKMPDAQRRGVDYLVDAEHVDIKSDRYPAVNVFLELECDGKPGCFYKSRADAWLYYFPREQRLYHLDLPRLQLHVARRLATYREVAVSSRNGADQWSATGILVPLAELVELGIAREVSDWLHSEVVV